MMKNIILLLAVLGWATGLSGQFRKGMNVEVHSHFGTVIKHTPELAFEQPGLTSGLDISLSWQTYGREPWQQMQKYPKVGVGLLAQGLGNPDTLGRALGIMYFTDIPISKHRQFQLHYQFSSGFALLSKTFDRIDNPNNNAIGSRLNVIAHMKLYSAYRFRPQWQLNFGISFTHFSNGAAQLPNFGLNMAGLLLGVAYSPKPLKEEDYIRDDISKAASRKLGLRLEYSIGYRESQTFGGPRYPIKAYSLAGVYYLNRINRVFLGMDYEFNRAAYVFGKNVFAFNSEREAFWGGSRIALFLADEFVFGDFGMTLQAGFYLGDFSFQLPQPIYFKLIGRYYVDLWQKPKIRAFAGLSLKSHFSIAEYFALNVGLEF